MSDHVKLAFVKNAGQNSPKVCLITVDPGSLHSSLPIFRGHLSNYGEGTLIRLKHSYLILTCWS